MLTNGCALRSISPISPLSDESGSSKGARAWEAVPGSTPSAVAQPEPPTQQASPDLPPPPGLGMQHCVDCPSVD